jgi:hypothetical protein
MWYIGVMVCCYVATIAVVAVFDYWCDVDNWTSE